MTTSRPPASPKTFRVVAVAAVACTVGTPGVQRAGCHSCGPTALLHGHRTGCMPLPPPRHPESLLCRLPRRSPAVGGRHVGSGGGNTGTPLRCFGAFLGSAAPPPASALRRAPCPRFIPRRSRNPHHFEAPSRRGLCLPIHGKVTRLVTNPSRRVGFKAQLTIHCAGYSRRVFLAIFHLTQETR